jgi:D-beta-D-heptose 7-phosphate kinase / D-beta-D-heptose 1-phosphate adenosyltransferase
VASILDQFAKVSVLVIGDVMLDRYLEGSVRRISPEAPVPVVSLQKEWECPGGAGNVAASIAGLGANVTLAGLIGKDQAGQGLCHRLEELNVRKLHLRKEASLQTITKTRVLAPDHHQLLRLDVDGRRADYEKCAQGLLNEVIPQIREHQVVCLADYEKGTLRPDVLRKIIEEARRHQIPCLIDPKKTDIGVYARASVLTPNVFEVEQALGRQLHDSKAVSEAAVELRDRLGLKWMIITRGAEGMTLASSDGVHNFPAEVREVADVAGAGDTVVATLATCLGAGWEMPEACRLASVAAGIAVSKPGVYVVQAAELERAWQGGSAKILDRDSARGQLAELRRRGYKVVFTNGCFDILHAGHLSCLERARQLGDFLVVGLNSDHSVKLNKGSARPIIEEKNRAALLAGLACVDMVVLFDDLTPELLVRHLAPDVLVKGGDYDPRTMAGADFVRERGGQVVTLPLVPGLSTTRILGNI